MDLINCKIMQNITDLTQMWISADVSTTCSTVHVSETHVYLKNYFKWIQTKVQVTLPLDKDRLIIEILR